MARNINSRDGKINITGKTAIKDLSLAKIDPSSLDNAESDKIKLAFNLDGELVTKDENGNDIIVGGSSNIISKPTITSPSNHASDIDFTSSFTSSAFSVDGEDTHFSSDWEVIDQDDSIVFSSYNDTSNKINITLNPSNFNPFTIYKIRVRHRGNTLPESLWSDFVYFTTAETLSYVDRPVITYPTNGGEHDSETLEVTSSVFNSSDAQSHVHSDWELRSVSDSIIDSTYDNTSNKESYTFSSSLSTSTIYKTRVRHNGSNSGDSRWSPYNVFKTASAFISATTALMMTDWENNDLIDTYQVETTGNATSFGTLTTTFLRLPGATSNSTLAFLLDSSKMNRINYSTTAVDNPSGSLPWGVYEGSATWSTSTRGMYCYAYTGGALIPQYITFSTGSVTVDSFSGGTAISTNYPCGGCGSSTRGVFGYYSGSIVSAQYIEYPSTIASFGNIVSSYREFASACSNSTKGLFQEGRLGGSPHTGQRGTYEITIATTGNSSYFGDLSVGRDRCGAASSLTRATYAGGESYSEGGKTSIIEYFEFATTGNANSFGNLTENNGKSGCSNGHGGLA